MPVRRGFVVALTLANLGDHDLAFFTPIQNLLPRLAETVSAGRQGGGAGVDHRRRRVRVDRRQPAAGALSDRTTSRFGRARAVGALRRADRRARDLALALQSTVLGLAVVWGVCQATINSRVRRCSRRRSRTRSRCGSAAWCRAGSASRRPSASCSASLSCRSSSTGLHAGIVAHRGALRAARAALRASGCTTLAAPESRASSRWGVRRAGSG